MESYKKILILLVLLSSAVFLTGCTDSTDSNSDDDQVRVIDLSDDEEDVHEDVVDDKTDDNKVEDETTTGSNQTETEAESDDDPEDQGNSNSNSVPTVNKTDIDGAISSDGAKVSGYEFGTVGGALEFRWKVKGSTDKPTPKVSAGYDSENNLVVLFPDLLLDSVIKVNGDIALASKHPVLTAERTGKESKYIFKTAAQKTYTLEKSEETGEIVLTLSL